MSNPVFPASGRAAPRPHLHPSRRRATATGRGAQLQLVARSHYQGRANILGTTILLDRKPYVVIGVMPRNFEFPLVPGPC